MVLEGSGSSSYRQRLPENEYSMMELARRIGVHVPETRLISTTEIQALPDG